MEDTIPKDFIKTYEAVQRLSITRHTLYKWLDLGLIKSVSLNGTILIPLSEIERLKNEAK